MEMKKDPNPTISGISVLDHCNAKRMALAAQLPEKTMRKRQIV